MNSIHLARKGLGFLLAVSLIAGCRKPATPEVAGNAGADTNSRYNVFRTHFQDESQYVVETIVRDLAEMAWFAKAKTLPATNALVVTASELSAQPSGQPAYDLQILFPSNLPPVKLALKIDHPIWAPEVYAATASNLLETIGIPTAKTVEGARDNPSLASALLDFAAEDIEEANQKISQRLAVRFQDPWLHEKAALVLGVFALREYSGDFYDVRHALCRMTAHLTLARALSEDSPLTREGQLAEAILYTLMNHQRLALDKLSELSKDPSLAPWARGLRARITGDYRELAARQDLTPMEWVMWFEAYGRSVNTDLAWQKLAVSGLTLRPDFCRIVYGLNYSVELGHVLSQQSMAQEMDELQRVYKLSQGQEIRDRKVVSSLNELPHGCFEPAQTGGIQVRVIGWGQWAQFCQRHLCHALAQNFNFMQHKWGVPETAAEFAQESNRLFGQLRLYPFVQRMNCTDEKSYHESIDRCLPLLIQQPHLIPPRAWNYTFYRVSFAEFYPPAQNNQVSSWHKHNPPPGTAYDMRPRLYHASLAGQRDLVGRLERLYEIAPYDAEVVRSLVQAKFGRQPDYLSMEALYRPLLDYSPHHLNRIAGRATNNPAVYEQFMTRAALMDASYFFGLGNYFATREQEEKAAGFYEKAIQQTVDEVRIANRCGWLVEYYFRKERLAEAEKLADRAAETYSMTGLATKGDLLFLQGKYPESFDYYLKIEERYQVPGRVVGWCLRFADKTGNHKYDAEIEKRIKALFPKGREQVSLKTLQGRPSNGVIIQEENDLVRAAGMKRGDIIVALNGTRSYDMFQYQYLRDRLKTVDMLFIFWDGKEYREGKARLPNHRFGVAFATYSRPSP